MKLQIAIILFVVISALVVSMVEGFAIHPVYAQTNTSNGNMTSAMVILARFHLKAADTALANGNNTAALNDLTLAQLQVLMLGTKTMGTVDVAQAMQLMKGTGGEAPNITGSIPIVPAISKATASELHISLSNAIATAERSVGTNAHAVFARLGLIHGFLMYTILVTDTNSNLHYVTVDVGNGKVLSSQLQSMMDVMRGGSIMMAMGPTMMMLPGMGMMIGPVMMVGSIVMNEPESYGHAFP